ncbi:MAG TPA: crosslink repair DNA glycosylase YcaQ family protein, partial [Acidimicrobiales bacterium]|nr:crosslink repair DNA glycosylase YcaQ family protein [Acidimicrobiales bacterium]
ARRIAVKAQLLDAERPTDLSDVFDRLTFLQLDPTAAIAPSADLVAWTRLGSSYQPLHLQQALGAERTAFEYGASGAPKEPRTAMALPMSRLGLYLTDMAGYLGEREWAARWLEANDGFRGRVLEQLRAAGPLRSKEIPDTAEVPWQSSGWTHDRNVTQMLEFLRACGQVAVSARQGKQRLWDLAERVYPPGVKAVPAAKARNVRNELRLRSLGVARPEMVGDAGLPAEIEGTAGLWRLDAEATAEGFAGRTALLSPFDRLIHNRRRAMELFDFEYTLEMYKSAPQRRWGYFALPILHGDQLVGKLDAIADRKGGRLRLNAIHQDVPFNKSTSNAVAGQLDALAAWLGLETENANAL